MDAIASALLLAAFILFVDLTFGEGNHRAAQLGGLFSSGASVGWPAGVQEDDHPWLIARQTPAHGAAAATSMPPQISRGSNADQRTWQQDAPAQDTIGKPGLIEETTEP